MDNITEEFDFIRSNFEAHYQTGFARWYKGKYVSLIDTPINLDHVKVLNKQFTAYKLGYYCHKANSKESRNNALKNILATSKMINRTDGYKLNACVVIALKALKDGK